MTELFRKIKIGLKKGLCAIKRFLQKTVSFLDKITDVVVLRQIKLVIVTIIRFIFRMIGKVYRYMFHRRINRSIGGDILLVLVLLTLGYVTAWPLIYVINAAFKPFDEIFAYPPTLFVRNPTLKNFTDLLNAMDGTWVPFTRYIFNTFYITITGTIGHILIASLCAYPLAKLQFKGKKFLFAIIIFSLMFSSEVTDVPNFIMISKLGLLDKFSAILLPAFQSSLGLYLMKQFMGQVPDSLIEAAKMDGANHFVIYWRVMMPLSKPAWLTLGILLFQRLWAVTGSNYIYSEKLKTMNYALSQIVTGGIARTGVSAALTLIMIIVPVIVFLIGQSGIMQTMATSGLKE